MNEKKILLIDGNSLMFRAYFASAYKGNILKTKSGIPTNAVYSFANMVTSILLKNNYYDVKVAFDKGKHTFRHEKMEAYKAGRQKTPDELVQQFPIVREFLDSVGINWFELDEIEADDIIGSLSQYIETNLPDKEVEILTSDKDMYQLISDKTIILSPNSGTSDLTYFDENKLFEEWNIKPYQVPDLKGLMGDSSDNLKGVSGIGKKTAIKLISEYETIENLYGHIDEIKGANHNRLVNDKESAFLCKEIATIHKNIHIDNLEFRKLNLTLSPLIDFFKKYEMYSLVNRFPNKIEKINNEDKIDFKIIKTWSSEYESDTNYIFVQSLEENYHKDKITGISISNDKGNFYINKKNEQKQLSFFDEEPDKSIGKIDQELNAFLKNPNKLKSTYDIKKTLTLFKNEGYEFDFDSFNFDMMIALYIVNPNVKSNFSSQLKIISSELNIADDEHIFGKGIKKTGNIDLNIKASFITKKSYYLSIIKQDIIDVLKQQNQLFLYEEIDFKFIKVLYEMEQFGVLIDKTELKKQTNNILDKINKIEDELRNILGDVIGSDFNFSSPKQLQKLLYTDLKIPDLDKGSTGKETLEKIVSYHIVIPIILDYRKYTKLYSTYLKGFEKYIFKDQKVHTIFNQTLTNTGRLSSIEPNLQNISVHDEEQKKVRKIFISSNDYKFYSFDYSQIELRVLAQMAPEQKLLEIFSNNGDVHEEAARTIFNLTPDQKVESEMRRTAKVFNFGIIYGLSDFGLSNDLKISISEAKEFIKKYYESFPDILNYKNNIIEFGKKHGYVATMANRRRYIDELKSTNYQLRQFGERVAVNMPIQGTAADILKVAMISIFKELNQNNLKSQMVAQIHDEIIIEVHESEIDLVTKIVKTKMEKAFEQMIFLINENIKVNINLKVSESSGKNWYELK